ncbi:MAG: DUF4129 domain-containing protein, partial [Acidobacteriota bacterium]|nr:DUF4129 domain-containing protein [Acidobacteriota bacterium]
TRELSLPEYMAELDGITTALDNDSGSPRMILETIRNLPEQWKIRHNGTTYAVRSEWLESALLESAKGDPAESRQTVQRRLAALRLDALAVQNARPDFSPAKQKLDGILARKEFRDAKRPAGPSARERLRLKILEYLSRLFGGIFGSSAFPEISKAIIWILAGAALVILAVWIYRSLKRSSQLEFLNMSANAPVSARPWPDWLSRARKAAAAENWRDAVRLAYWGGISFLESNGLWPPDRARTPREYLRMLPSSNEHRETLAALTRKFEAVWYGREQAGPESFTESLNFLERMGCHSS